MAKRTKDKVADKEAVELASDKEVVIEPISASVDEVVADTDLGTLGPHKVKIMKKSRVVIDGREFNQLVCSDNCVYVLSDRDLEAQQN